MSLPDQLDFGFEPAAPMPVPSRGTPKAPARRTKTAAPTQVQPGVVPVLTPPPVASAAPAASIAPVTPAAPVAPVASCANPMAPHEMAEQLAQHPDYRVLRRLQPRLVFPAAQGEVRTVVLLDTETTGLDASRDRIIELALLRVHLDLQTGQPCGEVQVYDGLEDPGVPISAEIEALTGISNAMVQGQALDETRVAELMQGAHLVIAHNAGFDRPFVESRLPRFETLDWACSFADIDWKSLGQSSAKLENLALTHGWFYDAHRAEMDCHALLAVLAQPLGVTAQTGLRALWAASQRTSYRLQATGAPFETKDLLKARGYRWQAEQRVWATRLKDDAELEAECQWLKTTVYGGRAARVLVETLPARLKYSARTAEAVQRAL